MNEDFFGLLLLAIQKRIEEMVPEIKYVNQDLGQLEVYSERPAVSWPCLLVDMSDTNYDDLPGGEQQGESTVLLRLGFAPFSQTSNLQPEDVRRKGLLYFAIEHKIHKALHGWVPEDGAGNAICQPLSRRRATTEKREEDSFRVRMIGFTTGFFDDGAVPAKQTIAPEIEIDDEN